MKGWVERQNNFIKKESYYTTFNKRSLILHSIHTQTHTHSEMKLRKMFNLTQQLHYKNKELLYSNSLGPHNTAHLTRFWEDPIPYQINVDKREVSFQLK